MKKRRFMIIALIEDEVGLLYRVTSIFVKRCINIESLNTTRNPADGVNTLLISVELTQELIEKVIKQLEKQIGIHSAIYQLQAVRA